MVLASPVQEPGFNPLYHVNQLLWYMPTIPALMRGKRQEDQKFMIILSYIVSSGLPWSHKTLS